MGQSKVATETLTDLLAMDWPELMIFPLKVPKQLRLLIGWTGSPASTSDLVDRVHQSKEEKQAAYEQFLMKSRLCVETMINGFNTGKISVIQNKLLKSPITRRIIFTDWCGNRNRSLEKSL